MNDIAPRIITILMSGSIPDSSVSLRITPGCLFLQRVVATAVIGTNTKPNNKMNKKKTKKNKKNKKNKKKMKNKKQQQYLNRNFNM